MGQGTPVFRRATDRDAPAIVALVESAYRGDTSRAGWTTEADLLDGQRTDHAAVVAMLEDPDRVVILAEVDGSLAGCCQLRGGQDHQCLFGMFAVRPDLQGRAIGDALLREAERVALFERGWRSMRMEVIGLRTELLDWYRRRGYTETGERSPFPYGDPRFGLPKRDDLEFVVLAKPLGDAG